MRQSFRTVTEMYCPPFVSVKKSLSVGPFGSRSRGAEGSSAAQTAGIMYSRPSVFLIRGPRSAGRILHVYPKFASHLASPKTADLPAALHCEAAHATLFH